MTIILFYNLDLRQVRKEMNRPHAHNQLNDNIVRVYDRLAQILHDTIDSSLVNQNIVL